MGAAYDFTIIHQRPPDRPTVLQRMDFPSRPYRVIFITFSVYFPISSEEFKTCLFAHLTLQWIDIPIVAWQQFNGIIPPVLESLIRCWQNAPCIHVQKKSTSATRMEGKDLSVSCIPVRVGPH